MIKILLAGILLFLAVRLTAQQEITVESIDFWKPVADTFLYFNHQDSLRYSYSLPQTFKKPSAWIEEQHGGPLSPRGGKAGSVRSISKPAM